MHKYSALNVYLQSFPSWLRIINPWCYWIYQLSLIIAESYFACDLYFIDIFLFVNPSMFNSLFHFQTHFPVRCISLNYHIFIAWYGQNSVLSSSGKHLVMPSSVCILRSWGFPYNLVQHHAWTTMADKEESPTPYGDCNWVHSETG